MKSILAILMFMTMFTFTCSDFSFAEVAQPAKATATATATEKVTPVVVEVKSEVAVAPANPVQEPTTDEWTAFLSAIGGAKGAGTLVLIAVIVQGLMLAFRTKIGELAGKFQFLIVTFLTMVFGVLGLKIAGLDWASVFMHSSTLAAFQVFINQAYKQFLVKVD